MPAGARPIVFGVALMVACVGSGPASAQEPTLPLEVRGVRAESGGPGAVRITFTRDAARLYRRRVAGRTLIVRCQVVDATAPLLLREERSSELVRTITTPAGRRPIRLRERGSRAAFDVCVLVAGRLHRSRRDPRFVRTLSLTVPVTRTGALFLRERALGDRLVAALDVIAALGRDGTYPTFAAARDAVPGLIELPAPDATPPPRRIGLYSDGAQHLTVVAVTLTGRRLFIDANGALLSSNVPEVVAQG